MSNPEHKAEATRPPTSLSAAVGATNSSGSSTPGPWVHSYPSATGDYLICQEGDDSPIAVVICTGTERGAANRDLICAVPKLLPVLKDYGPIWEALLPLEMPARTRAILNRWTERAREAMKGAGA